MRKSLTSLRAFVALFVFIAHLRFIYAGTPFLAFHELHFGHGDICVACFFMLSGLGFSLGYGERFVELNARDWVSFLWKRLKKFYPLYIVTILIMIAWQAIHAPDITAYLQSNVRYFFLVLTLTQTFLPQLGTSMLFNGAAWYLSAAFAIYLVTPLLLYLNHRVHNNRKATLIALAVTFLVFWSYTAAIIFLGPSYRVQYELTYFHPVFRLFHFVMGILIGNLIIQTERGGEGLSLAANPRLATGLEIAALVLWIEARVFAVPIGLLLSTEGSPPDFYILAGYAINTLANMLLVWVYAQQAGAVSRVLSMRPFVELGKVSFEFFLIHWVVIHIVGSHYVGSDFTPFTVAVIAYLLITSLAFSVLWKWLVDILRKPDVPNDTKALPTASA